MDSGNVMNCLPSTQIPERHLVRLSYLTHDLISLPIFCVVSNFPDLGLNQCVLPDA